MDKVVKYLSILIIILTILITVYSILHVLYHCEYNSTFHEECWNLENASSDVKVLTLFLNENLLTAFIVFILNTCLFIILGILCIWKRAELSIFTKDLSMVATIIFAITFIINVFSLFFGG